RHRASRPSPSTAPARIAQPPFRFSTAPVSAQSLGKSWHTGCPVPPSALVAVTMRFWGFDHTAHTGTLVVNRGIVAPVVSAFRHIYSAQFPIRRLQPIAAYGGSDDRSMAAD